jgi:hypothetical protein
LERRTKEEAVEGGASFCLREEKRQEFSLKECGWKEADQKLCFALPFPFRASISPQSWALCKYQ